MIYNENIKIYIFRFKLSCVCVLSNGKLADNAELATVDFWMINGGFEAENLFYLNFWALINNIDQQTNY